MVRSPSIPQTSYATLLPDAIHSISMGSMVRQTEHRRKGRRDEDIVEVVKMKKGYQNVKEIYTCKEVVLITGMTSTMKRNEEYEELVPEEAVCNVYPLGD